MTVSDRTIPPDLHTLWDQGSRVAITWQGSPSAERWAFSRTWEPPTIHTQDAARLWAVWRDSQGRYRRREDTP